MKIRVCLLLLLFSLKLYCLEIPDATLNMNLSDDWKYFGKDNVGDFVAYEFKRSPIDDSNKQPIIPTLSVYLQKNTNNLDTLRYLIGMRSILGLTDKLKITIIDSEEGYFKIPYAIGVVAEGIPKNYKREMVLILITLEYGDYCVSIICACTKDVYPKMEKDYKKILNSIELKTNKKTVNFVRMENKDAVFAIQEGQKAGIVLEVKK